MDERQNMMDSDESSARRSNLTSAQLALLDQWRSGGSTVVPGGDDDDLRRLALQSAPLSFAQERLWFLDRLVPTNAAYNVPTAFRLEGALDIAVLQRCLDEIAARHETLRTTFKEQDGEPVQVIGRPGPVAMPVETISNMMPADREAHVQRCVVDEALRPFDLSSEPLFRARLLRLDEQKHVLMVSMHHIICDGWSHGVLCRELALLYEALAAGGRPTLPDLPVQYADFAVWQRRRLQGEVLTKQLAYWKQQLADVPTLQMPTDHSRPPMQTYRGSRETIVLPSELHCVLVRLSQHEEVSLFMTLLSAFMVLLHRISGQDDIVVGSPVANRNRMEMEGLIGFFVNMLVMRADASGDPAFTEYLDRVRQAALGGYDHQELPFEKLVAELQPQRNLSHSPLFQVTFALQNAPMSPLRLGDLQLSPLWINGQTAHFDLQAHVWEDRDGLRVRFDYNTDLYEQPTIRRMLHAYRVLLESVASDPQQRLSELPLMSESQRDRILCEWNRTATPHPRNATVHELFEQQVERSPDAVALVFEDQSLTYRRLDARANQLAHHLRRRGVGPEVMVGICIHRSMELVVGILGILKAGGAYVALDPDYPPRRLAFMIEDTAAPVILAKEDVKANLQPIEGRVICLDSDWPAVAGESEQRVESCATAGNPAYLIYTSGSTGTPKGVTISHGSLKNLLHWVQREFPLEKDDSFIQRTAFGFDASVREIFAPLVSGARLVLAPPMRHTDVGKLIETINRHGVTILQVVPSLLRVLLEQPQFKACATIRRVTCGAELLPVALVHAFCKQSQATLHNFYGPTEATINATSWSCRRKFATDTAPIGKPIDNVQTYVLDNRLEPLPVGVSGELYLGGAALARGYWNRPDQTAAGFIPHPHSDSPAARLYRTGDRVRWLADGAIEFLGRSDHQVKIRGFRIELGEIEAAIGRHESVREVVVLVREEQVGDKRLVAYVVPAHQVTPSIGELRRHLQQILPDYMVPSAFVLLEAFPLKSNGKLDRAALPAPDRARPDLDEAFVGPRSPQEQILADIWAQTLGVERLGVHDNFFELGGHSLLATRLMARQRDAFNVDVPLAALFESPTVAGQAIEFARGTGGQDQAVELKPIVPAPQQKHEPFPLTDVQQAYWIGRSDAFELGNVATHVYWEVDSVDLDLERLNAAWQKLIERHDMLRAVVMPDGRQQILKHTPDYRFQITDLRGRAAQAVESVLQAVRERMSHEIRPADRWPLFQICGSRVDDRRVRLHFSFDALILDAWSHSLLFREWSRLYGNPEIRLCPLELSFRDCVAAEAALRDSPLYHRSKEYWQRRLDDLPPAPQLPLATEPGSVAKPRFVRRWHRFEASEWQHIKNSARRLSLTPSAVVLAAFSEVLRYWSRSRRFTINLTVFNRLPLHPQVNDVVGDFTSLNLLEVDADAGDTFEERAKRLQHTLWNDLDHRYFSGVRVLREVARQRKAIGQALMPVVFTSVLANESSGHGASRTGWMGKTIYGCSQTPQVWLDSGVLEQESTLGVTWSSVDELFPDGLVDDMFDAYVGLLRRLADGDGWQASVAAITDQIAPAWQVEQAIAFNATEHPGSPELLQEAFSNQVPQRRDQPAVISADRTLTYAQLERCAACIGRKLQEMGAQPNTLVAIVMEKGWEQIVAALGAVMSGAAYLPIESGVPKQRLWHLIDDGQVALVLTQARLDEELEWPPGVRRICVDREVVNADDLPCAVVQKPDDLAYVIYTSGSTGEPKGVMIDHRGAMNTIADVNRRFGVGPQDRVLALSSLSFDLSVYDIFGILAAGGTIVVPDAAGTRDPAHWARLASEHGVTIWNSVPALMELLVETIEGRADRAPESLRLILLSGDWIPVNLPDRIRALKPEASIISLGGATEASIWSILYPIKQVEADWSSIPYGRPMANQTFHVFNDALEARPMWVAGDLFIGGIGLARGYWRDEQKTRAAFITHPQTGERLYRTGDLGRTLPDGNIEFLGRDDFQVKIQGFRVELGEIEAAIFQNAQVRSAVVTARGPARGEKRLVAYIVAARGAELSSLEIRADLDRKLPAYMIPSEMVWLDRLPLGRNGKVDRGALPEPRAEDDAPRDHSDARHTPMHDPICRIVASVLNTEDVDPEADLLNLGATSVDIIRIVNRLESELGFRPKVDELYQEPTVAALAAAMLRHADRPQRTAAQRMDDVRVDVPIVVDPDEREAFKNAQPGLRALDGRTTLSLPDADSDHGPQQRDAARRSHRQFVREPIDLDIFSGWLSCLRCRTVEGKPKYLYASAGGLYPVQTYLYVKSGRIDRVVGGTYYYHPGDHQLVALSTGFELQRDAYGQLINAPIFDEAAFALFLIAQLDAIAPMYGEQSIHFATIEAGMMCQLLEMTAPSCGVGTCQIGGFDVAKIEHELALEPGHMLIHSLLGGAVDPHRAGAWAPFAERHDADGGGGRGIEEMEI